MIFTCPINNWKKIFSYFVKFCCDFLELLSFENSSETPYLLIFFSFSSPFSSCCNDLAKKKKKKKYNNLIMFLNYYFSPISVGQQNKYTFYIGIEKIFDFIFFKKCSVIIPIRTGFEWFCKLAAKSFLYIADVNRKRLIFLTLTIM